MQVRASKCNAGLTAIAFAASIAAMSPTSAAEIRVYTGGAPKEVLTALTPAFEKQTGHKVQFTYAVISVIQQKLAAGERPDMVLMPIPALDTLIKAGTLRAEPRPTLGSIGVATIVREGAARPDISTTDKFRKVLLEARSVVHADPKATPSGAHLGKVTEQLGLSDAMKQKTVYRNALDGGAEMVSKGEAEIGMFPVSEVISVKGVTVAGMLPPELQMLIVYGAGVLTDNKSPEAAQAFIKFLADPANRPRWKDAGFEPPAGS
jgi:molybdate transport system substrate-binding protein